MSQREDLIILDKIDITEGLNKAYPLSISKFEVNSVDYIANLINQTPLLFNLKYDISPQIVEKSGQSDIDISFDFAPTPAIGGTQTVNYNNVLPLSPDIPKDTPIKALTNLDGLTGITLPDDPDLIVTGKHRS